MAFSEGLASACGAYALDRLMLYPERYGLRDATAASLHGMMDRRLTPVAEYEARRCDACSLIELCQPKAMRFGRGAAAWFSTALKSRI